MINKIAVLGLGKIGHLVAELLAMSGFEVVGFDSLVVHSSLEVKAVDVTDEASFKAALTGIDAVVSCLPYHLNASVADVCQALSVHYFDLTEDVPTTQHIMELSKTSNSVMAPQCGLAPGFVGIVGADLASQFSHCRSLRMRVGALPRHPTGLLGYAFNWSPEGVVNEYLNDCEVISDGQIKLVSPMQAKEMIFVDGVELEAFSTSGGLGTMCQTYLGQIDNMSYKTIRYPGHVDLMNFFFNELLMRERRSEAGDILTHAKPPTHDDVVFVHVSAEGELGSGMNRHEFVRSYLAKNILGSRRTAIAWTTAASVSAVVELVSNGDLPSSGFIKQEDIPLAKLTATTTGQLFLTES